MLIWMDNLEVHRMLSNYHIEEGKKGKVENSSKSFESSFISQPRKSSSLLQN